MKDLLDLIINKKRVKTNDKTNNISR